MISFQEVNKTSLPMEGELELDDLKIPFSSHNFMILWWFYDCCEQLKTLLK